MNTFENSNQETGQTTENVGQDGSVPVQENSPGKENWEDQAKYFQSEKDKLYAENQKLGQFKQLGDMLNSRPDVAKAMVDQLQGQGQPQDVAPKRVEIKPDEFDPWEAYNDPSSKSFEFRKQQETAEIDSRVNEKMMHVVRNQGMSELKTQLKDRGLNPEQQERFMQFASMNPVNYGLDNIVNWFQQFDSQIQGGEQAPVQQPAQNRTIQQIQNTQATPASGGVLQGQQPQQPSDDEDMWKGILGASRGNKIP